MNSAEAEEVKKRIQVVCICKAIKMGKVLDAIEGGALTLADVNAHAGTGRGDCRGSRCGPAITKLLEDYSSASKKKK